MTSTTCPGIRVWRNAMKLLRHLSRFVGSTWFRAGCAAVLVSTMTACGDASSFGGDGSSGSSGGTSGNGASSSYSIGGTLSGLDSGQQVVLQDNGANSLTVNSNGTFTFSTAVSGTYAVTVMTQPAGQTCSVSNASGKATANVTNVAVDCANAYSVSASVVGLAPGSSVVLQNSGSDNTTISTNGTPTTLATGLAAGAAYDVTVLTQPAGQTCSPQLGPGTITAANISMLVVCVYSGGTTSLSGTYTGTAYSVTDVSSSPNFVGSEGSQSYDGMGDIANQFTVNTNGTITTNPPGSGSYAVTEGSLLLQSPLSNFFTGGLEGANQNIVVYGNITASNPPSIEMDVKQGSGMSLATMAATAAGGYWSGQLTLGASSAVVTGGAWSITANGIAAFSGQTNTNGVITPENDGYPSGSATLSSSGLLAIPVADLVGQVSPDYEEIAGADETSGHYPSLLAAVRIGSGESAATLNGQYTVVMYSDSNGGLNADDQVLTFIADGQGNYTSSGTDNSQGTIASVLDLGTYSIIDSGAIIVNSSGGTTLDGGVSEDGNVFVLWQITDGHAPALLVGVRQ